MFVPNLDQPDPRADGTERRASSSAAAAVRLRIEMSRLDGLDGLDAQIGSWPKSDVIPALANSVLGKDGALEGLGSFALLDAAKIPDLPDLLEASGLDHRCLFKGEAEREHGHVAPWLLRLEPESRILRRLFTGGVENFGYWDKAPAIYLRSPLSLDALWRHLRKFTKVEDAEGRWIFLRFWDPATLEMIYHSRSLAGAQRFFEPLPLIIAPQPENRAAFEIRTEILPMTALPSQPEEATDRDVTLPGFIITTEAPSLPDAVTLPPLASLLAASTREGLS